MTFFLSGRAPTLICPKALWIGTITQGQNKTLLIHISSNKVAKLPENLKFKAQCWSK